MGESPTIAFTATHSRRAATAAISVVGAFATLVLALATVMALLRGPSGVDALNCSTEAPSEACLARLPHDLRGLPAASVGVWFYAQNAATARSPYRYLKAQASWARLMPPNATGADMAKRNDGRVPSPSALEGELRMREAALPKLWKPKSSDRSLRILALPFGLGVLLCAFLTVMMGLRSRRWAPVQVKMTNEHVFIGADKRAIADLTSVEVAPFRLVSTSDDLVLPEDYELQEADHEQLVDALETAIARSRDMFADDD